MNNVNHRFVTADEAVSYIRSGSHVHLSSIASVPQVLVQALKRRADVGEVKDLHFHHFHTEGDAPYSAPEYAGVFFDQGFFVGPNVRANVNAGYADYLPAHLYESQAMYRSGAHCPVMWRWFRCRSRMRREESPWGHPWIALLQLLRCQTKDCRRESECAVCLR